MSDHDKPLDPPSDGVERRRHRERSSTTTALILIVVGVALLLGRAGLGIRLDNWWALFILIPAATALAAAYRAYQAAGGIDREVTSRGLSGAILLLVTAVFLFGLDWGLMGAVVIILVGVAMYLRRSTA